TITAATRGLESGSRAMRSSSAGMASSAFISIGTVRIAFSRRLGSGDLISAIHCLRFLPPMLVGRLAVLNLDWLVPDLGCGACPLTSVAQAAPAVSASKERLEICIAWPHETPSFPASHHTIARTAAA